MTILGEWGWVPACAGMTVLGGRQRDTHTRNASSSAPHIASIPSNLRSCSGVGACFFFRRVIVAKLILRTPACRGAFAKPRRPVRSDRHTAEAQPIQQLKPQGRNPAPPLEIPQLARLAAT